MKKTPVFKSLCLFARDTEDKLEQSQKTIMERESMLHRYKKDYKNLKMELIERSKQGKRWLSGFNKLNIK